jgi:cytochrome b6-f complex iron-sulfur subunit
MQGSYVAVTLICSHEQRKQVTFTSSNEFLCTAHQARFDTMGMGLNANGSKGLKTYPVMVMDSGKTLMIG